MPKQRITKEMVVSAAFELARSSGIGQVTVKSIAQKLNCSVQPIYSYCENMEGLRNEVAKRARLFIARYVEACMAGGSSATGAAQSASPDLFRHTGQAYVRLAKEEPHVLEMFLFQKRENVASLEDFYRLEANQNMAKIIADQLGVGLEKAKQLHLHMLLYTIGLGAVCAVTSPGVSADEIFLQQEQAYEAFLKAVLEPEPKE